MVKTNQQKYPEETIKKRKKKSCPRERQNKDPDIGRTNYGLISCSTHSWPSLEEEDGEVYSVRVFCRRSTTSTRTGVTTSKAKVSGGVSASGASGENGSVLSGVSEARGRPGGG